MITFNEIHEWRRVWKLCDTTGDVSRLFDDKTPYSRQGMKKRIQAIVECANNRTYEIMDGNTQAGCFILYDLKDGVKEVHNLLKKEFRGSRGIYIGKCGTEFALNLEGVKQLVSFAPKCIPESIIYAKMVGWKSLGTLPFKWLWRGVEYDVIGLCAN